MNRFFLAVLFLCSAGAYAEHGSVIIGGVDAQGLVAMMEDSTDRLAREVDRVPFHQRRRLAFQIDRIIDRLERISAELSHGGGGGFGAGWFQADRQECVSFCRSRGMMNDFSPEGAMCVSGESQALSAVGKIVYSFGTWGGGPAASLSTQSSGQFCYKPGQKKDGDRTDITVGCYCRR